jgi:1-acyl-sn-glycerol-3-phosphate acyltransferase
MLFIRSLLYYIGSTISLVVFGLLSLLFLLINKKIGIHVVLTWNKFILTWLKVCCGISVEVKQEAETIPKPCVIVSNHQCAWETIYLQLYFYPLTTVLKKELLNIPFFGWGLRLLEPIAIDRSQPVQALKEIKKTAAERIKNNKSVLIFPEGTRKPVGEMGSYTRSAADIAKRVGVPVLPVVHNAGCYWPNKKFIKRPGKIQLIIGQAIDPAEKDTKTIMEDVEKWTQEKLVEIYK